MGISNSITTPRETPKTFNMPPITDDEVIDAAASEKTEDTTDAKAAEPEAKEEAVEEKKEEEAKEQDITIDMRANYSMKNQNPNYGEFLSTMSTSTTNINQKIWTSLDKSGQVWTSLDKDT